MKIRRMVRGAFNFLFDSGYRFCYLADKKGKYHDKPDEEYLRRKFIAKLGYPLNLREPTTFNEKLQWLKLHDRNPIYTEMVDKYQAKKYYAFIGEQHIIPTLGIWERFDEIDFDRLPNQFVLKCTHDSGGVVLVRDKRTFDRSEAREKLERHLKREYYWIGREWPYKDVRPRILAEPLLQPADGRELVEYKILCSYGEPKLTMVCKGKAHSDMRTISVYDMDFNMIPVDTTYPRAKTPEPKPAQFEEMLRISRQLSQDLPFLRADMYLCDGQVFLGELTLYHSSGFCRFDPPYYDTLFGEMIDIERARKELGLTGRAYDPGNDFQAAKGGEDLSEPM